jgi:hypothetical protein
VNRQFKLHKRAELFVGMIRRVYDDADNVVETQEHVGEFKELGE